MLLKNIFTFGFYNRAVSLLSKNPSVFTIYMISKLFTLDISTVALSYVKNRTRSTCEVDFKRTTRRHIPEDVTLHNHRCENLKFCNKEYDAIKLIRDKERFVLMD
jgi:hypothetical protein